MSSVEASMDLTHVDRLMLEDLIRVQKILSGDDMLTIIDQLYPYLKGAERSIDYQRFCSLAIMSVGMVKDEPKEDWKKSIGATMLNYLKRALGAEFVPSTAVPDEEPGGNERQSFSAMANNWLGETREGMVGKLNAEQTCRMIAAVNVSLGPRSDAIYWYHILETSGLKDQGANVHQLENKYRHLATMCGVRTVSEYLKYHAELEPRCDTLTHQDATDVILFPQNEQLVTPEIDSNYVVYFTDGVWSKVLHKEYNRVFWGKIREGGLANKNPEDWKLLFNGLRVRPSKTGEEIMTEFYAHVLPCLRTPQRFKFEGLRCPVKLRVADNYTMMVIVGAFRKKTAAYDIEDVYETFNWLNKQGIISFRRQGAYRYWGERFFEYLESCDIATFPGNKQKLVKLKARWGFQ